VLLSRGWRAHATDPTFLQDAASMAILAAAADTPLRDLAGRVVPWRVLQEARRRGGSPEDAQTAANAIDAAITGKQDLLDEPRPFEITIETDDVRSRVAHDALPPGDDFEEHVVRFADPQGVIRARDAASQAGRAFMQRAQNSGARLYAQLIAVEDVLPVVKHCADQLDQWLEGMRERSRDFRGRVLAAAGLFRALCEALLITHPQRGVELWRALKQALHLKFIGPCGIDDMLHMVFRVRESPEVLALCAYRPMTDTIPE
jgi:hypothetical protein